MKARSTSSRAIPALRLPAEWEPHAATWLAFPHHRTDWPGKLSVIPWAFAEAARALCRHERVRLLVGSQAEAQRATRIFERAGVDLDQLDLVRARTNRSWARDFLPLFAVSRSTPSELIAVKWRFNGWARYRDHLLDDKAGLFAAKRQANRVVRPKLGAQTLVLEGGAIDVDGQGTLLSTLECLVSGRLARFAPLSQRAAEQVLQDFLNIEQVIWLPNGIAGDDTSGHVDDFARFVAPGRVVVCREPRRSDANHLPLKLAAAALKRARDARGRQLEVIELPMPRPLYFAGQRLPASYANFYIGNGSVLVPTFNDPADRVALDVLATLFKGREIVGIHAVDWVLGLGSLHCSTMQEPKVARPRRAPARKSAD